MNRVVYKLSFVERFLIPLGLIMTVIEFVAVTAVGVVVVAREDPLGDACMR